MKLDLLRHAVELTVPCRRARAMQLVTSVTLPFLLLTLFSLRPAQAANPTSGSIAMTGTTSLAWVGTATGTGASDEPSAIEGTNGDTYTLTVTGNQSAWKGKVISISLKWSVVANDYDLYVHKDSNAGPIVNQSAGGAPQNAETVQIEPYISGVGVYTVHAVYFACNPTTDQYHGSAKVMAKATATYLRGGMTFSPNVATRAPVTVSDAEPSSRTDKFGNAYVAGIRGVPAGVDLWYFNLIPGTNTYDPRMRNPIYRGQPDAFLFNQPYEVGADGGGDVDIAVGFDPSGPDAPPTIAFTSLTLANVSAAQSKDAGLNWILNPLGNVTGGPPVDDRQWLEFYGKDQVYLFYRTFNPAVGQVQCSLDGGLTYGPAVPLGLIGQAGNISVDQNDGTVYASGSTGVVAVGIPPAPGVPPAAYTVYPAATDPAGVAHLFFVVKAARDGTVYVCYSNDKNVYVKYSKDKAKTWSPPLKINNGADTLTAILPWMECGPTPGSIGVVWYGTTEATNNANANWKVFYAQVTGANTDVPIVRQATVSDHFIHAGVISEMGLDLTGQGDNRNLLDYFQVSFDPLGAAVIAYSDDHDDINGHVFVSRQIDGPTVKGDKLPELVEGPSLPAPPVYNKNAPQVVDFAQDVAIGLLAVVPQNDPLDILSITYKTDTTAGGPYVAASMKVSDLASVPASGNWRMTFAANVPYEKLSTTQDYNFGITDRGDQFWVGATTDSNGVASYVWGTAVRNRNGSITYTAQGPADAGSFDLVNKTVNVKVSIAKLNAVLTSRSRPLIKNGTTLAGLRGMTFSGTDSDIKSDQTRGGTHFIVKF